MSRSPLAYPLNRAADTDVGGAADLQTDVMRFMAILALCLVAIFALVQSIPLTPVEPQPVAGASGIGTPASAQPGNEREQPIPQPLATQRPRQHQGEPARPAAVAAKPAASQPQPTQEIVVLTRPQWVPKYTPPAGAPEISRAPAAAAPPAPESAAVASAAVTEPAAEKGFTLRFASDAALMRSVAAHHVGVYAIDAGRARRMTVSESRISFWDASTPNAFHEMEAATVPVAVTAALARSNIASGSVQWGVTLPGRMTAQLDALMREHRGGDLVIGAGGDITWEASR